MKHALGALCFSQFTIHGATKRTWTRLGMNALAGSNTIQLQGNDYPNWEIGDEIVIAPSSWEPAESEIRIITDYDRSSGTNLKYIIIYI